MVRNSANVILLMVSLTVSAGCATLDQTLVVDKDELTYLPPGVEVDMALAAGPEHIRPKATVYVFGATGYQMVRKGTNGMACLVNRDGHQKGDRILRPTCWDIEGTATIVPIVLRVGELIARGASASDIDRDIDLGFQAGRFTSPRKSGIAYMLKGDLIVDDQTRTISKTIFPPHYMIYAPGVSNADIGMTEESARRNPWLPMVYGGYTGGYRTAYIIIVAADSASHVNHEILQAD